MLENRGKLITFDFSLIDLYITAEDFQLCYTNHPVLVIGVICVDVDTC